MRKVIFLSFLGFEVNRPLFLHINSEGCFKNFKFFAADGLVFAPYIPLSIEIAKNQPIK